MKINFLHYIGYWGPIILLVITTILILIYKMAFFKYYILFYFIGFVLNCVIKLILKEPRPKNQKHLYKFEKNKGIKSSIGQSFGMPSGHAQTSFYSLFTLLFIIKNYIIGFIGFIITMITCWQRYIFRNHTLLQLFVGSLLGILCFFVARNVYLNNLTS